MGHKIKSYRGTGVRPSNSDAVSSSVGFLAFSVRRARTVEVMALTTVPWAQAMRSPEELEREIRSRQEAEEALRQSEARYRAIVAGAPIGICMTDLEGRILDFNSVFQNLTGYASAELRGMDLAQLSHPDHAETARRLHRDLVEGKIDHYKLENRYHCKDGRIVSVRLSASVVNGSGGKPQSVVGMIEDVSESQRGEEAVRAGRALFESLFESVPDAIVAINGDGQILRLNRQAEVMFGYSREELLTRSIEVLIPERLRDHHVAHRQRFFTGPKLREMGSGLELHARRRDGSEFPVDVTLGPAIIEGQEAVLITVRDITKRKRLEEQLRQVQKMEAVGCLAGGVAHEVNNMMTIVTGYCEILLRRLAPGDQGREIAAQIKQAGDRTAEIAHQLLAVSRKQPINPVALDLNAVVGGVVKMLRTLVGEDVAVVTCLEPCLGAVKADQGQIEQVLINLAANARDAMRDGGTLTVQTANRTVTVNSERAPPGQAPGPYVLLSVRDSGCGMEAATKARLFEPFFTTKELGKGTGLGLAVVHGIVEQSGGHIEVESAPGQGSTFFIFLPRCQPAAPLHKSALGTRRVQQGTETVLLVEDEAAVRHLARLALETAGYHVLEAAGGEDALTKVGQYTGPLHLLLTDLVMPEMSGIQLADRLASLRPDLRVLFVSGYPNEERSARGLRDCDVAFLQKPFTPVSLVEKVRSVLDDQ